MTERDPEIEDIEFDFFDEPETQEVTQRQRLTRRPTTPRGPGRPPRRPVRPAQGLVPLLRLTGLIAFAILVVLLIVFGVRRCSESSKTAEYRGYMNDVRKLAQASAGLGSELNDQLTTPGIKEADLESRIDGLAQQQQQDLARAQEIVPPGPLRIEHRHLIDALQLRAAGLGRLEQAFRETAKAKSSAGAGDTLAQQVQLLTASDVVWDFYFLQPSKDELRSQKIGGVDVPDSNFVANADLATPQGMQNVFRRIHGASTGGTPSGLHGTGLISVKALPANCSSCSDKQTLSSSGENTIVGATDLAIQVTVQDTGDNQEVQIPVTITIDKSPQNIVRKQTIDVINPGQTKTLLFRDLGAVPFATKTTLRVAVTPVKGEQRTSNNSAEYPVIFSLAP